MSLIHQTLTPASLAARRRNAQKSTGPRTPEGQQRVALSLFQRVGPGLSLRRSTRALGENPRRFKLLLAELVASHQPATPSEMMLVEDLAALRAGTHGKARLAARTIGARRAPPGNRAKPCPDIRHRSASPPRLAFRSRVGGQLR